MPLLGQKLQYSRVSLEDSGLENRDSSSSHVESSPCPNEKCRNGCKSAITSAKVLHRMIWVHVCLVVVWVLLFSSLFFVKRSDDPSPSPDRNSMSRASRLDTPQFCIRSCRSSPTGPLFSALSYSSTRFNSGFAPDLSVYQGVPNETNNAAWNELTHVGMVALTESEQSKLPEKSSIFMNSTENSGNGVLHLGAVEVFHQLHCLDMLRMEIHGVLEPWYKKHSPHNIETRPGHLEHCIEYIRQSMMCRPSLDVLPFWTDPKTDQWHPVFNGTRTCADFTKIKDWAVNRKAGNLSPQ